MAIVALGPFNFTTAFTNGAPGKRTWVDAVNAVDDDADLASCSMLAGDSIVPDGLLLQGLTASDLAPLGANEITGIVVEVFWYSAAASTAKANGVGFYLGGETPYYYILGTGKLVPAYLPVVGDAVYQSFGGSTDTWGGITKASLLEPGVMLGVFAAHDSGVAATAYVKHARITVYYDDGGGAVTSVTAITPSSGVTGTSVNITDLAGTGFLASPTVTLTKAGEDAITATSVTRVSDTKITCSLDLTVAAVGDWTVRVTNTDESYGELIGGFEVVYPAPTISEVSPVSAVIGDNSVLLMADGAGFMNGATLDLRNGEQTVETTGVVVSSSTHMGGDCQMITAPAGPWTVRVTNPDAQYGELVDGFEVLAVTTISPTYVIPQLLNEPTNGVYPAESPIGLDI